MIFFALIGLLTNHQSNIFTSDLFHCWSDWTKDQLVREKNLNGAACVNAPCTFNKCTCAHKENLNCIVHKSSLLKTHWMRKQRVPPLWPLLMGFGEAKTEVSQSVLLNQSLPAKVMLRYISYPVRDFVPNPLQCFRCHIYGHVTPVCRREIPRCGKCAGGHGIEDCVDSVEKSCVCNCRGAHVARDRKCPVRERQVEEARVRVV